MPRLRLPPWGIGSISLVEISPRQQGRLHGAEKSRADPVKRDILPLRTVGNVDVVVPTAVIQGNDEGLSSGTYSRNALHARQQCLLITHLSGRRQLQRRKININHQEVVLHKASIQCHQISERSNE